MLSRLGSRSSSTHHHIRLTASVLRRGFATTTASPVVSPVALSNSLLLLLNNNTSTCQTSSTKVSVPTIHKRTMCASHTYHHMPILAPGKMNDAVVSTKYAVRGELVKKAEEYKAIMKAKPGSLPFDEIIHCNIGNPQELGQIPITYYRQIISLVENPDLLKVAATSKSPELAQLFPADTINMAQRILQNIPGGTGAYSHSQGLRVVRELIADFITKRDGFPSHPDDLFLTDGASPAVQRCINLIIRSKKDGIMIPIPQYPLYSASIPLYGGTQMDYYLNEESGWGLSIEELERSWADGLMNGLEPRALVIINPGNPTGQVLSIDNMKEIVDFCKRRRLVLLADEVYQENVYQPELKPFHSFKKVVRSMDSDVELISFHSVSKGVVGECGKRGGYLELTNIHPEVKDEIYKLASISLCPNLIGQIMMGLVVTPPLPSSESYALFTKERQAIYDSLKRRATKLIAGLNQLEGVTCNAAEGAMYAFPKITIPQKAIEAAKKKNIQPDLLYAFELLDATGICIVPGSGFGQKDGTYHFRTTFLPHEDKIDAVIKKITEFHNSFMAKYH